MLRRVMRWRKREGKRFRLFLGVVWIVVFFIEIECGGRGG